MYEKHPLNVWPDADADDYAGILGSIRERGYDDSMPVVLYEGKVLDGWQRCRACDELGMEPETRVFEGDDDDALAYAAATNKRRNLSSWQKACAAADAVEVLARIRDSQPRGGRPRNDGKPNQKVGEVSDAHDRQTATKVAEMFGTNREYASKAVKLRRDDPETFGMAKAGLTSYDDVRKMEKKRTNKDKRRKAAELTSQFCEGLRHGDFREVLADIPDGSVRLILTDPPYPKQFLPLWGDLAKFASRVLTDDGLLISYSGQMFIPQILSLMTEHLDWWWMSAVMHKGNGNLTPLGHPVRKVINGWKPLLMFAKKGCGTERVFRDVVSGAGAEKDRHNWQQPSGEAQWLIENYSDEDDLVIDPFAGSNTVGHAASLVGRRFIGAEVLDDGKREAAVTR